MTLVQHDDMGPFLAGLERQSVDLLLTSPPYSGLPARADTHEIVHKILTAANDHFLAPNGSLVLIVGAAGDNLILPYEIATLVEHYDYDLQLKGLYIWDRQGTLNRRVREQNVTNDVILHIAREDADVEALSANSIIRTAQAGFNYGRGVTTPPDLAAFIIGKLSKEGDLVVDPLAGLGEIGIQALHQKRRFAGCDNDSSCVDLANARLTEHLPLKLVSSEQA